MSKHKKSSHRKSKKSSKCPEPFNSVIDLAGGLAMAAIAGSQEKKHNYSARGKINPYAASAIGIGTGKLKNTGNLLRMGAVLGMTGSFDDDGTTGNYPVDNVVIEDDPLFSEMNYTHTNENRYAWRLNCEDGSFYGIKPEDYETREEYNEALYKEKYSWRNSCEDGADYGITPEEYETEEEYDEALERAKEEEEDSYNMVFEAEDKTVAENDDGDYEEIDYNSAKVESDPFADDDFHVYVYCLVKLPAVDEPIYYRTEDHSLRKGDKVIVSEPRCNEDIIGEILSVEHHMKFSVPVPVEKTQQILKKRD